MLSLVVGRSPPLATMAEALARRGHAVVLVASPGDALAALRRGPTPAVVALAATTGEAAVDAIRLLRTHVRGERAAVVALVPDLAAAEAALDAGALVALPGPLAPAQADGLAASAERVSARSVDAAVDAGHELLFVKNPSPMWFFDVDTLELVAVNDAAVAKYGWSREEFLRLTLRDIRPPEDLDRLLSATSRVADGLERTRGWRHRARDGTIFHVEIISYPVRYAGRSCELVLAHDVSDQVRAMREIEELQARVAFADRMASMGTLAAGVAHEINNPLTYVVANLDYLALRLATLAPDDAHLRDAIAEAEGGVRRVQSIVRDLRSFSRTDEETQGPVELARVADAALALAGNELRHRARAHVDLAGAPAVVGNASRLGQVFLNLFLNAAQAIPVGDAARNEVRVTARAEGAAVVVDVADTGRGIPPEIRGRIFDPFFTTKSVGEGTGLGLWVCRRIVTGLGGDLEALARPGGGSILRLRLPIAGRSEAGPDALAAPGASAANATARRPRVLVVDDEPLVGRALQRLLRDECDIELEGSARSAVGRLERGERFDLLLADVMMPELSGPDLHREVARLAPALAARMIFMTGGAFSAREREFLAGIPNTVLEKPLDLERLRAAVRAAST